MEFDSLNGMSHHGAEKICLLRRRTDNAQENME
jgi:hypothetical protein